MTLALALVAAAVSIGSVHTLAPDHWMPFAALARAERWSARRTAAITAACGLGHVTGSVALGLLSIALGTELLERFGRRLESASGLLLIGFGVAYAVWGLRRRAHHHHHHHHGRISPEPSRLRSPSDRASFGEARQSAKGAAAAPLSPAGLFVLFSADPCVAVIPLIFASAPLGWATTLAVIVAYEVATIGTMVALVLPARAAAVGTHSDWIDHHSDALAGAVVALVGVAVVSLGI
jgi:nickel/cobalt transporter (NicO) family protein